MVDRREGRMVDRREGRIVGVGGRKWWTGGRGG